MSASGNHPFTAYSILLACAEQSLLPRHILYGVSCWQGSTFLFPVARMKLWVCMRHVGKKMSDSCGSFWTRSSYRFATIAQIVCKLVLKDLCWGEHHALLTFHSAHCHISEWSCCGQVKQAADTVDVHGAESSKSIELSALKVKARSLSYYGHMKLRASLAIVFK